MEQSPEQKAFLENLCFQNEFNAFCVDCQKNRSTHANVSHGTFICEMCANYHYSNAPMGASYIKTLTEVWDPYQLRAVQIGGNKALYEFLRDYGRERDEIEKKYKSDPARFYARSMSFRVKNLPYLEKAPPKNA